MAVEKGLPTNREYETLILGSVLLDADMMHAARPVLAPEDFATEKHRHIWHKCCELYDAGQAVECATVIHALHAAGQLESCDGFNGVNSLMDGVPRLPSLDAYVQGVKDKSTLRAIINASQHTINRCLQSNEKPQDILESLGQMALTIAPQAKSAGLRSVGEIIDAVGLSTILRPRTQTGLRFPWQWMNYKTGGMLPAELWILAGHTSTGKTSAMLQHAVTAARRGQGVALFSLEVGAEAMVQKAIYQFARVDSEIAKRGKLDRQQSESVNQAATEIHDLPLYLDTQSTTTMAIHAAVRRLRLKHAVDHVIVDYLQLLGNSGKHDNRAQAVGANAWALKMLATDFQVPVLLLSQFSRQSNKPGQQREPDLTDLKESGDIENHANGVWFLHRMSNEDADQIPVKFILPKQRDGRRNVFTDFWFMPQFQRFEQATTEGGEE